MTEHFYPDQLTFRPFYPVSYTHLDVYKRQIVLHLDHKRPYKTKESIEKNINIRRNTRKTGITETPFGIKQLH